MTRSHYAVFRGILGIYLYVHFLSLLPWATELFGSPSAGGMLSAEHSPLMGVFPNILGLVDAPWFAVAFVGLGAALSGMLAVGFRDRWAAVILWYVWACLLGRNPLILNPGIPYVGWLLLMHAALPTPRGEHWRLPKPFLGAAWTVMALGYTFGGLTKLGSVSWMDGSALQAVLQGPLARPTFLRAWLVSQPEILRIATYATLALEILAAPLAISDRLRPWLWVALTALQVGILVTIDFGDLTWGMLMIHLLTFQRVPFRHARLPPNSSCR